MPLLLILKRMYTPFKATLCSKTNFMQFGVPDCFSVYNTTHSIYNTTVVNTNTNPVTSRANYSQNLARHNNVMS